MDMLSACWRGLRVIGHIFYGLLMVMTYPTRKRAAQRQLMQSWARRLLAILRVKLETRGDLPAMQQGRLLVANHISWLDAMIIAAATPAFFVAKSEVGGWPLIGWLCRRVDTLFIRRHSRRDAMNVKEHIAALLLRSEFVAIFPEGTTTNGRQVGHFHSSLLQGALDVNAIIQPVAVRYHDDKGNFSEDAAYIDDMTFVQSIWRILRSRSLQATLIYLPVMACNGQDRRTLASEAHGAICAALATISADAAKRADRQAADNRPR